MKMNVSSRWWLPAILALLVAACDLFDDSRKDEATGVAATPTLIKEGEKLAVTLKAFDTLHLAFQADSGSTDIFVLSGARNLEASVRGPDGSLLYSSMKRDSAGADTLSFPALSNGRGVLRIVVTEAASFAISMHAATGYPKGFVLPDSLEPSGTRSQASPVVLKNGAVLLAATLGTGIGPDVDWFRFAADSGFRYAVRVTDSSGTDLGVSLHVFQDDSAHGLSDTFEAATGMTCLVRVSQDTGRGTRYFLRVTAEAMVAEGVARDGSEFDDIPSRAGVLRMDTLQWRTLHGIASSSSDVDWVKFHADSGRTYRLALKDTAIYSSLRLSVHGVDTVSMLSSSISSAMVDTGFACVRSGMYFAKVTGIYPTRYGIKLTVSDGIPATAVADLYEPDNSMSGAKLISTNGLWQQRTITFSSTTLHDTDMISFKADSGNVYELLLRNGSYPVTLGVVDGDGRTGVLMDTVAPETAVRKMLFPCWKSGSYYVRATTILPYQDMGYNTLNGGTAYGISVTQRKGLPTWALQDLYEPDGEDASGLTIPADGGTVVRRLSDPSDTDWIDLAVKSGRIYTVVGKNASTFMSFWAEAFDEKGESLAKMWAGGVEENQMLQFVALRDTVYRLKVMLTYPDDGGKSYSISVSWSSAPEDPQEPNDGMADARSMLLDSTVALTGTVCARDEDWLRFEARKDVPMTLFLRGTTSSDFANGELYGSDSALLQEGIGSGRLRFLPTRDGTYWIRLHTSWPLPVGYSMSASVDPADLQEPDNDMASAVVVGTHGEVNLRSLVKNDTDWMKFPVKAGWAYRVRLVSEGSINARLCDAVGMCSDIWEGANAFRAMRDETMHLVVSLAAPVEGSYALTRVSVEALRDSLEDRSNDSRTGALPIVADSTLYQGWMHALDDDWYGFHVDSGVTYNLRLELPAGEGASISTSLEDPKTGTLYLDNGGRFVAKDSGTIYLHVADRNDGLFEYGVRLYPQRTDAYEPDDSRQTARPLVAGDAWQVHGLLGLDEDWMVVDMREGESVSIGVETDDWLHVSAYDEAGTLLQGPVWVFNGKTDPVMALAAGAARKVSLKVAPYYWNPTVPIRYSIGAALK